MPKRLNKIISILISVLLLLEQSAFAAGGAIDLSSSFSKLASGISSSLSSSSTNTVFRPIHLRYLEYLPKDNSFKLLLDKGSVDLSLQSNIPSTSLRTPAGGEAISKQGLLRSASPLARSPRNDNLALLQPNNSSNPSNPSNPITQATQDLMQYFYIGLTLPNDSFWVNLRPDSPDNIIDSLLSKTDIGRILLEADVELKKDTASYTNPATPEGKVYWNKLYKKAEELFGTDAITIPTLTRPWIVPGEIIIRETDPSVYAKQGQAQSQSVYTERGQSPSRSAYIYKATLKVMLEEDYLKAQDSSLRTPAGGEAISKQGLLPPHYVRRRNDKRGVVGNDENSIYQFNDPRLKELNSYSTKLIKELIIPKLTKEVNSSERYASLRQVYYSLIMAQWFKARYHSQSTASSLRVSAQHERSNLDSNVVNLIDSKNLSNLTSKTPWNKQDYYNQYQQSFTKGEYNTKETVYIPSGQVIRSYMSGGMRFVIGNLPQFGSSPLSNKQGVSITCLPASSPIVAGKRMTKDGLLLSFTFGANPELLRVRRELGETAKVAVDYIKERDKKPEGKRKFGLLKYAKWPLFSLTAFGLFIGSFLYDTSKYADYSFNTLVLAEKRSSKFAQDQSLRKRFSMPQSQLIPARKHIEQELLPAQGLSLGNFDRDFAKLLNLIEFGTSMEMEAAIFTLCLYANAGDIKAINYLFNLAQDGNLVALEGLLGLAEWEENQLIRDMLNNMDVSTLAVLAASDNKALGILAKLSYNFRYMREGDLIGSNDEAFAALVEIANSLNLGAMRLLLSMASYGDKRAQDFLINANREIISFLVDQTDAGSYKAWMVLRGFTYFDQFNSIGVNAIKEIKAYVLLSKAANGDVDALRIIAGCLIHVEFPDGSIFYRADTNSLRIALRELDISAYIARYNLGDDETRQDIIAGLNTLVRNDNVRAKEFLDSLGLNKEDTQEDIEEEGGVAVTDIVKIIKDTVAKETINEQFTHIGGASSAVDSLSKNISKLEKELEILLHEIDALAKHIDDQFDNGNSVDEDVKNLADLNHTYDKTSISLSYFTWLESRGRNIPSLNEQIEKIINLVKEQFFVRVGLELDISEYEARLIGNLMDFAVELIIASPLGTAKAIMNKEAVRIQVVEKFKVVFNNAEDLRARISASLKDSLVTEVFIATILAGISLNSLQLEHLNKISLQIKSVFVDLVLDRLYYAWNSFNHLDDLAVFFLNSAHEQEDLLERIISDRLLEFMKQFPELQKQINKSELKAKKLLGRFTKAMAVTAAVVLCGLIINSADAFGDKKYDIVDGFGVTDLVKAAFLGDCAAAHKLISYGEFNLDAFDSVRMFDPVVFVKNARLGDSDALVVLYELARHGNELAKTAIIFELSLRNPQLFIENIRLFVYQQDIADVVFRISRMSPALVLGNSYRFSDFPWAEAALEHAAKEALNKDPEAILKYADNLTFHSVFNLIVEAAKKCPRAALYYASKIHYDSDIIKQAAHADPLGAVIYKQKYSFGDRSGEIFKKAVFDLIDQDPKEVLKRFDLYKDYAWAIEVILIIMNKNPDIVLEYANSLNNLGRSDILLLAVDIIMNSDSYYSFVAGFKYKEAYINLPGGRKKFKKFVMSAVNVYPGLALEYYSAYAKEKWADTPLKKAVFGCLVRDGSDVYDADSVLEFASCFINKPYAREAIEKAAKYNSISAVVYMKQYINYPWGKELFKKSVFKGLKKYPGYIVSNYLLYKDYSWSSEVLLQAVRNALKTDVFPYDNSCCVLENCNYFISQPWAEETVREAAFNNMQEGFENAYKYISQPWGKGVLQGLSRRAVVLKPTVALRNSKIFMDKPYAEELIHKAATMAAEHDPVGAITYMYRYIHYPWAKDIVMQAVRNVVIKKGFNYISNYPAVIYINDYFINLVKGMSAREAYAIALAAHRLMRQYNLDVADDYNIRKALDFILIQRKSKDIRGIELFSGRDVINIFHDELTSNYSNLVKLQASNNPRKLHTLYVGKSAKKAALEDIVSTRSPLAVYLSGHSNGEEVDLSEEPAGYVSMDRDTSPFSITFEELGDALIRRGNLQNLVLFVSCCHAGSFEAKLRSYLEEKGLSILLVFTSSQDDELSYGGDYVNFLLEAGRLSGKDSLSLGHVFDAENSFFLPQNPTIIVRNSQADIDRFLDGAIPINLFKISEERRKLSLAVEMGDNGKIFDSFGMPMVPRTASSALNTYIKKAGSLANSLFAWVNFTLNTGNISVNLPDNLYANRLFSKVRKRINSDVVSLAINEYQGTNSGPGVLYLPTINIKDSDLGYNNALGPRKQQLRNPYDAASRLPLIRDVRLPDKDILLVSSMINGTSGVVKLGFLPDGRPVALKSYFPSNFTADYKRDINDFLLEDYNAAIFAEDLGIGPQVHGVFLDGARPWFVMDIVAGDFIHKAGQFVNLQTFEDLLEIKNRLEDAGRYFGQDFQYFVSSDGHIKVIDQAGLFSDYQGVVVGDAMYVSIIERILFNTNIRTRDKIIRRIYESSPYLLSDIAKISTLSVKKHINTFLSAKKFYLDRNLSGYFSKKKFMPSVEEMRLKLSAKIKLLAGRNLPVNVEVVGNESGRNSFLFYLHIGNRRWVVKFADYKGSVDINAIVWSKELLISELAREKGFFSDIAANNPVDFLNALGFLRESALLHDAVADMKHIDWRTLHRLMKDFFMIDDFIFTVSSYVQGKSEWEDLSALPREDRIFALRGIDRMVSCLHQNNVFHRDLRPEQIIFNKADKRIVLIDFENSVIFDNNDQLTFGFPYSNTYYSLPEMVAKYFRPSNKDLFMLQDRFALAYMKKEIELGERVPFNFSADLKQGGLLTLLKTTSFQQLLEKPDILLSLVQGASSAINVNVRNNKGLKDNVLVESKDKFSSSPVKDKDKVFDEASLVSKQNNTLGGIDFRSLPIVTQAASNLGLSTMSQELRIKLMNFNLRSELNEIERLTNAGITPSTQRIKEYVQASMLKEEIASRHASLAASALLVTRNDDNSFTISPEDAQKLLSCIAEILRKQEEECCITDPTLKDILAVLESGIS